MIYIISRKHFRGQVGEIWEQIVTLIGSDASRLSQLL